MTLRLNDDDTRRLRAQAEREGRSMHEVALSAVRQWTAGDEHVTTRDALIRDVVTRRRGMLDELADL